MNTIITPFVYKPFDELMKFCIEKVTIFSGGRIGETALHIAARIENSRGERCTQMLIKSGADINLAMSDGKTPLHASAETGTISVLRYLLANGAEPMKQDNVLIIILSLHHIFKFLGNLNKQIFNGINFDFFSVGRNCVA